MQAVIAKYFLQAGNRRGIGCLGPDPAWFTEWCIGLDHFGLGTDDIEAAVEEFKAKGVTFKEEVRVVNPELKIAFLWAPNNALIELLERK